MDPAGPVRAENGEDVSDTLAVTVRNVGTATASAPIPVQVVMSDDRTIGQTVENNGTYFDDVIIAEGSVDSDLPAGGETTVTFNEAQLPFEADPDWYFLCGEADPDDDTAESDETNNVSCHRFAVELAPAETGGLNATSFDIVTEHDVPFRLFNVLEDGQLNVEVRTEEQSRLTVQLTGRRRPTLSDPTAPYAETTGETPLTLSYDVTPSDLARGTGWRLIIRDARTSAPSERSDVNGTLEFSHPFDATEQEQFEQERIRMRSGDIWPSASLQSDFMADLSGSSDGLHGIITVTKACTCKENQVLRDNGFTQQTYLPGRHAFGHVEKGADPNDPSVASLISRVTPLEPEDKIDPNILVGDTHSLRIVPADDEPIDHVRNDDGTLNLSVTFADDVSRATASSLLTTHAVSSTALSDRFWEATVQPSDVVPLAENDAVEWIGAADPPMLDLNDGTRREIDVDDVQDVRTDSSGDIVTSGGLPVYDGLTGDGVTVAVIEGGQIDEKHTDLDVVNPRGGDGKSHKTHVAGTVAGTGKNSDGTDADGDDNGGSPFQWRGMAPEAQLYDTSSATGGSLRTAIVDNSTDARTHSHVMSKDGRVNGRTVRTDRQVAGDGRTDGKVVPRIPVTWAAGNEGGSSQYSNQVDYFSVENQSKNSIMVGNWWSGGDRLSRGSSLGPAYDGRLAPTVVAPGTRITSTDTDVEREDDPDLPKDRYSRKSGTSMATPAVGGTVALLLEAWEDTYHTPNGTTLDDTRLLPSTFRAVLAQTAEDIVDADIRSSSSVDVDSDSDLSNGNDGNGNATATTGPDFATGFGLVDAQAAVDLVTDARTEQGTTVPNRIVQGAVSQGDAREYEFAVDGSDDVKVTLGWDDVEGAEQAVAQDPQLVNDLDLELVDPNGTVWYPWQLGQEIHDGSGSTIPPENQTPGTDIAVERPILATDDLKVDCSGKSDEEIEDEDLDCNEDDSTLDDDVPQDALTGTGAWVAERGRDHLNTIEQVVVPADQVTSGHWTVRVVGFDVRSDLQDFSLVGMPYPDLADLEVVTLDKTGIPGFNEDIDFDWSVANQGPSGTGSDFDYEILLSDDFHADAGDQVLNDRNNSSQTLSALSAGNSHSLSSTVQIDQSDAAAVTGDSSATFEDLIASDPFLLVHVDSDEDVLEHRETNTGFVQVGRLADVVLVFDRSGSMSGNVPVSAGTRTKLSILKDSGGLFFDLMRLDAGDRVGSVSFSGSASDDVSLSEVTSGNVSNTESTALSLNANGGTDIREALQNALDQLPSSSDERRRVVIFFSDGEATTGGDPSESSFLSQFDNKDVKVYSVGFGTPGGSGYAGIDVELLQTLSTVGENGFFQLSEEPGDLDKFFVDALAGAVDEEMVIDPVADLAAGASDTVDIGITEEDATVTFVTTWDDPGADPDVSVVTPSGATIDAGNVGSYDVAHTEDPAHELFRVDLPLHTGSERESTGTWRLQISNNGSSTVRYSASATADTTLRGTTPAPSDDNGGEPETGDSFTVSHDLTGSGGPIGDADVRAVPTRPTVGVGDVLSSGAVTSSDLASVPSAVNGDDLSTVERMLIALRNKTGRNPIPRVQGTPFDLSSGSGGSYSAGFSSTTVPGPYDFTVRSSFRTEDCADATRESTTSIGVEPQPDAGASNVTVTTPRSGTYVVETTPRDKHGNHIGPGHEDDISIDVTGPLTPVGPVLDRLDGSYRREFQEDGSGSARIEVTADGVVLGIRTVSVGGPTVSNVTPAGGSNDSSSTVTLDIGGSASAITGVKLLLDGTAVPVSDWSTQDGDVRATVPDGLAPGRYSVVVESEDGELPAASARTRSGTFDVVGQGQEYPAAVDRLAEIRERLRDPSVALFDTAGPLLQAIRELPLEKRLTSADRNAAARQALSFILDAAEASGTDGDDQLPAPDLPAFDTALELARIDARYFDVGDVPTPAGENVTTELGDGHLGLRFGQVTEGGSSTFDVHPGPPGVPKQRRGTPHVMYDVRSTADFDRGAGVELTFRYHEGDFDGADNLHLFHRDNGQWMNVTTDHDPGAGTVTGRVPSLSPFMIVKGGDPIAGGEPSVDPEPPTACPADEVPTAGFDDVDRDSVHADNVDCVVWWGIAEGRSATTYAPTASVRRDQMASFLARLLEGADVDLPADPPDHFGDDDGTTHEHRINQLAEVGIVKGVVEDSYAPESPVRRDQMATLLVRATDHVTGGQLAGGEDAFADDDGSFHEDNINTAAAAGFTTGRTATTYAPHQDVRRDQMASFLARVLDHLVDGRHATLPTAG